MDPIKEKVDKFTDAFLTEATNKASAIIREVQESRNQAEAEVRKALQTEVAGYVKKELSAIQTREGSRVSARLLQNKRTLFSFREQCAVELVRQVRERVLDFVASPAYPEHMKSLLKRGLEVLDTDEPVTVYLRAEDMKLKNSLTGAVNGSSLSFETGDFQLGGLALLCQPLSLRVDLTFDSVLIDAGNHFAELSGIDLE